MLTQVFYTGDGATRQYDITFPYLNEDYVFVSVDGEDAEFTWATSTRIELATAPAVGASVKIYRSTPLDQRLVVFEDGATLTEEMLNLADSQLFDNQQELSDAFADEIQRSVKVPSGETAAALPAISTRANKFLAFDADGNPVATEGVGDEFLRDQLADGATGGANLVAIKATGASAQRNLQAKLDEIVSALDFGAAVDTGDLAEVPDATEQLQALADRMGELGGDLSSVWGFGAVQLRLPENSTFRLSKTLYVPWYMLAMFDGARLATHPDAVLGDFDLSSMIVSNADEAGTQLKAFGGSFLRRYSGLVLWNEADFDSLSGGTLIDGLDAIYSKASIHLDTFSSYGFGRTFYQAGVSGNEYIDQIEIKRGLIYDARGSNYPIDINAFGDNLRIENIKFQQRPELSGRNNKGVHIKNTRGGVLERIINGYHLVELSEGMEISGLHLESGGLTLAGVSGILRTSIFYHDQNEPPVIVKTPSVNVNTPPLVIENNGFVHNTKNGWAASDYGSDTLDIDVQDVHASVTFRGNYRTGAQLSIHMRTPYTAAKVGRNGATMSGWENSAALLGRDAVVTGSAIIPKLSAAIPAATGTLPSFNVGAYTDGVWQAPSATYYYRMIQLIGPVDRRCGQVYAGGQQSRALTQAGNGCRLGAGDNATLQTNSPAAPMTTTWFLRGTTSGSYTHQVFAPLMGRPDWMGDLGYNLHTGEMWQEIAGGPIAGAPTINSISSIRLIGNDNVEVVAAAAPTVGTWKALDRVINSAPAETGTAGSKYVVTGWLCVTGGSPGTWVEQRALTGN